MSKPLQAITNRELRLYRDTYERLLAAALTGVLSAEVQENFAFHDVAARVEFARENAVETMRVFINGTREEEPR